MAVKRRRAAHVLPCLACLLLVAAVFDATAEEAADRCRRVAAVAAAEVKAGASEPLSQAALEAARDGALRGCMASVAPTPTSPATSDAAAAAEEPRSPTRASSGPFEFLTGEAKRSDGHKRLRKRGKF